MDMSMQVALLPTYWQGYEVEMLHQFRRVEVLRQRPVVAGSPPG